MMKPKLSILCITYNHEKFIRQALDGFVMQKTNFPFEVIIHDDASTDGTADIIREYAKKYPKIIKPIFQTENQWSKGKLPLIDFMLDKVQGEYVAMCEGDDYWIDENKLQKQVNFLDKNPEFTVCFHPVKVIWEDNSNPDSLFPTNDFIFNKDVLTLQDLLEHNFIQTNSVVYRWGITKQDWPKQNFLPCDYMFHLLHAKQGKIKYLNEVMAVYRKHSGGVWNGVGKTDDWFIRCGLLHARFFQILQDKFKVDRHNEILWMASKTVQVLLKHNRFEELQSIQTEFPTLYDETLLELAKENFNINEKNQYLKKFIYWILGGLLLVSCFLIFFIIRS